MVDAFDAVLRTQYSPDRDEPAVAATRFAEAYALSAKGGIVAGADMSKGGDITRLEAAFASDNTPATIDRMAEGIAEYWATAGAPGSPAHGGERVESVSVSVDPAAVKRAIMGQVGRPAHSEGWVPLLAAIENVIKSSAFVIVEIVNGTPTPFEEHIQ